MQHANTVRFLVQPFEDLDFLRGLKAVSVDVFDDFKRAVAAVVEALASEDLPEGSAPQDLERQVGARPLLVVEDVFEAHDEVVVFVVEAMVVDAWASGEEYRHLAR